MSQTVTFCLFVEQKVHVSTKRQNKLMSNELFLSQSEYKSEGKMTVPDAIFYQSDSSFQDLYRGNTEGRTHATTTIPNIPVNANLKDSIHL